MVGPPLKMAQLRLCRGVRVHVVIARQVEPLQLQHPDGGHQGGDARGRAAPGAGRGQHRGHHPPAHHPQGDQEGGEQDTQGGPGSEYTVF